MATIGFPSSTSFGSSSKSCRAWLLTFEARTMTPRIFLTVGALLIASTAAAAPSSGKIQYDHCLTLAATNGNDALREALLWQQSGGGAAADHCMAVAFVS